MTTRQVELTGAIDRPAGLPAGYLARPAALVDAPAVTAMLNLSSQALLGADLLTVEEVEADWRAPGIDLTADTRVVLAPDGAVAGYAYLWDAAPHVQLERLGRVHPGHLGLGLGSYLIGWSESRAREILRLAPAGARVALHDEFINRLDTRAQSLLSQHGYAHVRTNWRMVIDLDADTPPASPAWPAGIRVRSFVPGQDDRAALQVIRTAFHGSWGYMEMPFEENLARFTHHQRTDPLFDPSLWFLAVAGDEVIATAFSRMSIADAPDMGWIFSVGVLPAWRRRGLAGALLQHCFGQLWQRGRRKVGLGVDADNATNAVHLYQAAGMRPDPQHTYQIWEKVLRPGD